MRNLTIPLALVIACFLVAAPAFAQEATTADSPVPPRTGFQLALRTGYMVPFGNATAAPQDSMGNTFSGQVPLIVDIGGKPIPRLFLGGYVGLGLGGAAGVTASQCDSDHLTCVSDTFRIGIEAQYQFAPAERINPWIGYGLGLESSALGASSDGNTVSVAATGFEFAHFMGGMDFRLSRTFGMGPVVDFSMARFSNLSVNENGTTISGGIPQTALHEWLMVGVRVVFFP